MLFVSLIFTRLLYAQDKNELSVIKEVEPQPLLAQVIRLADALDFLGSPLSKADAENLKELQQLTPGPETVKRIQEILDPYCLAMVNINPEARVKVSLGPGKAQLTQGGWTSFLVKVHNEAGVTAQLEAESPNARPIFHMASGEHHMKTAHKLSPGEIAKGFLEIMMYRNRPLQPSLSGLKVEYAVLQIYSRDAGRREAEIGFNIGQGSQDIGFRNSISVLFNARKPVKVIFRVKDDGGKPAMASFIISDGIERLLNDSIKNSNAVDYRLTRAVTEYWSRAKDLKGLYPLPSRRLASHDEYPDFFFQPQVYRSNGEHVMLPPGRYAVKYTRGPEYLTQTMELVVPPDKDSIEALFRLRRWVNMARLGWYSGDHHVHAAGCSHYESPEEGVLPIDMQRQQIGEDLNVAAVLTWGPGWYHQKKFFTGKSSPLSTKENIMRYDVEVSGFPSSHAGHIVLLRLSEDDYPGTASVEDWPTWTLPILKWAKSQNGITGYAHSGLGLEPVDGTQALPNQAIPKMDGIGANEYIVTVTQDAVDFYSAGDTPIPWELNIWYHTLNCGYRTRLSAETDFPCMYDERVGMARSYFKTEGALDFDSYAEAIRKGRSYISDGRSHIIDFSVNGIEAGTSNSEVNLTGPGPVKIRAKVAAYLPAVQDQYGKDIASRRIDRQPYWNIERARIGATRKVPVEVLVNGQAIDTIEIVADGNWNELNVRYTVTRSCWIALRVLYSAHTNPVFVLVHNNPVAVKQSAEWCLKAVDQCWKMKKALIREDERPAAEAAYNSAKKIYGEITSRATD